MASDSAEDQLENLKHQMLVSTMEVSTLLENVQRWTKISLKEGCDIQKIYTELKMILAVVQLYKRPFDDPRGSPSLLASVLSSLWEILDLISKHEFKCPEEITEQAQHYARVLLGKFPSSMCDAILRTKCLRSGCQSWLEVYKYVVEQTILLPMDCCQLTKFLIVARLWRRACSNKQEKLQIVHLVTKVIAPSDFCNWLQKKCPNIKFPKKNCAAMKFLVKGKLPLRLHWKLAIKGAVNSKTKKKSHYFIDVSRALNSSNGDVADVSSYPEELQADDEPTNAVVDSDKDEDTVMSDDNPMAINGLNSENETLIEETFALFGAKEPSETFKVGDSPSINKSSISPVKTSPAKTNSVLTTMEKIQEPELPLLDCNKTTSADLSQVNLSNENQETITKLPEFSPTSDLLDPLEKSFMETHGETSVSPTSLSSSEVKSPSDKTVSPCVVRRTRRQLIPSKGPILRAKFVSNSENKSKASLNQNENFEASPCGVGNKRQLINNEQPLLRAKSSRITESHSKVLSNQSKNCEALPQSVRKSKRLLNEEPDASVKSVNISENKSEAQLNIEEKYETPIRGLRSSRKQPLTRKEPILTSESVDEVTEEPSKNLISEDKIDQECLGNSPPQTGRKLPLRKKLSPRNETGNYTRRSVVSRNVTDSAQKAYNLRKTVSIIRK